MQRIQRQYRVGIGNLAIGIALFVSMLFNKYILSFWISVAIFVFFLFFLWKNSKVVIKYILILFSSLQYIGGGILCEAFPQYLREIGSFTSFIGAIQPLLFYYWFFFTIIWMLDKTVSKYCKKHIHSVTVNIGKGNLSKVLFRYGFVFVFAFNLALFLMVVRTPAFRYGLNRFDYNRLYLSSLASKMSIFPLLFCPLIVTVFWKERDIPLNKVFKRLIIAYLPYVLYGIWTGNKFGLFTEALFCLLMVFYDDIQIKKKQIVKIILIFLSTLSILYLFLFIYYRAQGATNIESLSLISNRIVVEGELWWKIFSMSGNGEMHLATWKDEIQAVINSISSNGNIKEYGVYHLMNLAGVSRIVREFMEQGIRYAAQGIEIPYYSFGYISLFITPLVFSPLFVVFTNLYIYTAKKGLLIAPIVYLRILLLLKQCFRQGDWFLYFSGVMIVFYFALFISIVVRYSRRHNIKRTRIKNSTF